MSPSVSRFLQLSSKFTPRTNFLSLPEFECERKGDFKFHGIGDFGVTVRLVCVTLYFVCVT